MNQHRRRPILLLALLALLLTGAGPADNADSDKVPALEGRWAKKVVMTSVSDPPIVGEVTARTITYLKVDLRQEGRTLRLANQTCDIDIDSDSRAIRTVIPTAFVEAMPDGRRRGVVVASEEGPQMHINRQRSVLGARLRQPVFERLPTSSDDPRLVDTDGDGHPGVTVRIEGLVDGELYLVQRAWDAYTGQLQSPTSITGTVSWETEQSVVGSTSMFLRSQPPTRPHADDRRNRFEMVRIPERASCRWILDNRRQLFGQ